MVQWRGIPGFLGYSVSDGGLVRNDDTDRIMKLTINSNGVLMVGLMQGKKQYKKSVPALVIESYHRTRPHESFNTPIHLDGDRFNNTVENLMVRPLWFARKYMQQFNEPPSGFKRSVEDIDTNEKFDRPWNAAVKFGIIEKDIILSTIDRKIVWPTGQVFRAIH